jgi:hypothetical protein
VDRPQGRRGWRDFSCYLAGAVGDVYTLQEAKDSAGTGAQNLAIITEYHTNTGNGSDAWTRRTQAAGATVTTAAAATQNAMVVEVEGTSLSDGYKYVKLTSTGAGTVNALTRDLLAQRAPATSRPRAPDGCVDVRRLHRAVCGGPPSARSAAARSASTTEARRHAEDHRARRPSNAAPRWG